MLKKRNRRTITLIVCFQGMQNSIEMIGFCFFILFFMVSPRHLLIFSSGIKVIDKLFEEKLAKMLFFL